MPGKVKWMLFAAVTLVSTSAWAVFDPDGDASLKFNMNLENNPTTTTTVDAKAGMTGTVFDHNTVFNIFKTGGIRGTYADFNSPNDKHSGAGDGNDVSIHFPGSSIFEFGDGWPGNDHTTYTFWFKMPNITSGTFFRHEYIYDANYSWEVHTIGGNLEFRHYQNCLRMATVSPLSALGVTNDTWHHAAIVIDRTTETSSKIYIDGLETPVSIVSYNTDNMNVDTYGYWLSPFKVGVGGREFEGFMDELRIYNRVLNALDISLLYQYNPAVAHTVAVLPIPRSSNVSIATDVNWIPATAATAQKVYFGTNPAALVTEPNWQGDGTLNKLTNGVLHGPFALNTTYYWYVKSTIGGTDSNSPVWSFTTETGKAFDPSPANGAEDIDVSDVNLAWSGPASALSYDVYYSTNPAKVQALDPNVRIANHITSTLIEDVNTSQRSANYYWCVVSNFSASSVTGDIWTFRTRPYEIIFNTSGGGTSYQGHAIPAYTCMIHGDGWTTVTTGKLDGLVVDFNFPEPNGFNYNRKYDITVVPAYRARDMNSVVGPRPLAIHVTGDFYFDGRIRIAGDDITDKALDEVRACCGGYPAPQHNSSTTADLPDANNCWTRIMLNQANYYNRFGMTTNLSKEVDIPTANAIRYWGPGVPLNPPYKGGGGGGSGGNGGDCGRGYYSGIFSGGYSYGGQEVGIPLGGSGGGWGSEAAGASGGGGIEIVATGSVTFDSNSEIRANGGNALYPATQYPGGGGGGGSVKIIAGTSFTNKGIISVNGGQGGNTNRQANECGGGGGGGRVAIFYGTTYSNTGTITARGGPKGIYPDGGASLADDGQNGTIYVVNSSIVSPKKASGPTPKNGEKRVYCHPDPCTIQLKWYSGYGGTTDVVYCDTSNPPTTARGTVSATRTQHSVNMVVSANTTYYMQIKTDGTVLSDVWSFRTSSWKCAITNAANGYIAGPPWDCTGDCVVNFDDFWNFAKDWRWPRDSGNQDYTLDNSWHGDIFPADGFASDLARFVSEWLECYNRTDNGCNGW